MIVINADDFGLSENVNKAIIDAFKSGLCSSTTLMATMPGFEEACELAQTNKLYRHIGIHLVLRDGFPITSEIRKVRTFCDSEGRLSIDIRAVVFSSSERRVLAEEMRAQIRRCRAFNIPITHLDSHYHTHNHWAVLGVLVPVVRSEGIAYVRIARNIGDKIGFAKRCYKGVINRRLVESGLAASAYFGSVEDYVLMRAQVGEQGVLKLHESLEIMIHPRLNGAGEVVNYPSAKPLNEAVRGLECYKDAVAFSGARYA